MSNIFAISYDGAVTPTLSDTVNDPLGPFAGIYVGSNAGDVKVTTVRGQAVVFKSVPVGTFLRIQTLRVWSTGTTSTNLLGLQAQPIKSASS